jgi:uncharacterized protein involved in response to NO
MATSAERIRAYQGPALFSYGFRPFFLFAGVWAAFVMAWWLGLLTGHLPAPGSFSPVDWHAHELLFGYLPAVVAGFLLTAVPNWTGRLPIVGPPLAGLFGLWVLGRVVLVLPATLPGWLVALADLAFLAAFALAIGREIVAGRNWRNLPVLGLTLLMLTGNAAFHVEAAATGTAADGYGARLGLGAGVFLIALIGGRIVPSFTRNWLARRPAGHMPASVGRFDHVAMAIAGLALLVWIVAPRAGMTGWLCIAAGVAHVARLARWAGWRTGAEPLVTVLHVGYAFVPIGFLLVGLALLRPDLFPYTVALHAWLAGAIGVMTLAVMTRASLGHTGRPLAATPGIAAVYALAVIAALARLLWGVMPSDAALHLAALAWVLAFGGFAVIYAPLLALPRSAP